MSPYRVIVVDRTEEVYDDRYTYFVLSARLSKDKIGNKYIYITRSTIPIHSKSRCFTATAYVQLKAAANLKSGNKNSIDVDKYEVINIKEPSIDNKYGLLHVQSKVFVSCVPDKSLQSCLEHAMEFYCDRKNLRIVKSL